MKKLNSPIIPFHKGDELKAFTLVEMLISMTIFAVIMVSVMMIYVTATDISKKYDINREMRNNIKSVVEDIAEEVRMNDIKGIAEGYGDPFIFNHDYGKGIGVGTRLKLVKKIGIDETKFIEYRLVKYNKGIGEKYKDISDTEKKGQEHSGEDCTSILDMCRIVKFDENGEIGPLSNSQVSFTNLSFAVTGSGAIPKVTINFTARASVKEGIRAELAKKTTLVFQTSISERALKVK